MQMEGHGSSHNKASPPEQTKARKTKKRIPTNHSGTDDQNTITRLYNRRSIFRTTRKTK
jgi:hypothetical protein